MPKYPEPKLNEIEIPRVNEIPFRTAFAIKAETGVDLYASDDGERIAAVTWWTARILPQYRGLTYDDVLGWSLAQVQAVSRFADADSVVDVVSTLPVEPDLVIPEDGIAFPVVDP
jgi:hypothetical protein